MKLKIKKLNPDSKLPTRMTSGSIGYDVYANEDVTFNLKSIISIPLGFAIEVPDGYGAFLYPRSSFGKLGLSIPNSVGVIDSDYRGEVHAILKYDPDPNSNSKSYTIKKGDRIGQLILTKVEKMEFEEVKDLSPTDRGTGGFGSTGK